MYSAEDRKRILETMKEKIINDDNIYFVDSAIAYTPISRKTFYAWFPVESEEFKEISLLLEKNKLKAKDYIRGKLKMGDKSSELLALYRMICTEEERKAIATNYNKTDITSKGDRLVIYGLNEDEKKMLDKARGLQGE